MRYLTIAAGLALLALVWSANSATNTKKSLTTAQQRAATAMISTLYKKKASSSSDDDFEYEESELERQKRSEEATSEHESTPQLIRKERSALPRDSALKINLVSFHHPDGSRYKRATYHTESQTWPRDIPYKFDEDYTNQELRLKLKAVMREISDNVCVNFIEVPDFDPENNSFMETNAYLRIINSTSNICSALLGEGSSASGPRNLKPCTKWSSMLHEVLHTLGVIHEQQGPEAKKHLIIHSDNVKKGFYGGTYKAHDYPDKVLTNAFDGSGNLMYSRRAFTSNALDVMVPYDEEEFYLNDGSRTNTENIYKELNEVYQCKATCGGLDRDCNGGYFTKYRGKCTCRCADGFDWGSDCTQLDDATNGPQTWPDVPFNLYAASEDANGVSECPNGFSPAEIILTGNKRPLFYFEAFFRQDSSVLYKMCSRDTTSPDGTMAALPAGEYCVVKAVDQLCDSGFQEGSYIVPNPTDPTRNGDYGEWDIIPDGSAYKVVMKYCCRWDKPRDFQPLDFPRNVPFRLISDKASCPMVKGMRGKLARVLMFVTNPKVGGDEPKMWKTSFYLVHNYCTYRPADYGCNMQVEFDKATGYNEQYVSTPGYETSTRINNKRCLYHFKVPEGGRLRITIHEADLGSRDEFKIRRFSKWSLPYIYKGGPGQFLSEGNEVMIEYWSGSSTTTNRGAAFTIKAFYDSDLCYEVSNRGADYIGDKSVSEHFEECLPWWKALQCEDFPFDGIGPIELMNSENKCRNPLGAMNRPWCYVSIDNTGMCRRAYCDVCNQLDAYPDRSDCNTLIANDVEFCSSGLQKMLCPSQCALYIDAPAPNINTPKCNSPPTVPSDGVLLDVKEWYYEGERARIGCNGRPQDLPIEVQCQPNGQWPHVEYICDPCPTGSIPYVDVCITYDPQQVFIDEAHSNCSAQGGRIFIMHNEHDRNAIRAIKGQEEIIDGASWVNTEFSPLDNSWMLYDDHTTHAPFIPWIDGYEHIPGHCAVMIYEVDPVNAGLVIPTDCNLGKSRTFCEVPSIETLSCGDRAPNCPETIAKDPYFCSRPETYKASSRYCARSCGDCENSQNNHCSSPHLFLAHRTSPDETVNVGDVMTFACDYGYTHTGGDLIRACGPNSQFFGQEPQCSFAVFAPPMDVGMDSIMTRNNHLPLHTVILFEEEGYKVPMIGEITHWHFYAHTPGYVTFIAYRQQIDLSWSNMGSNTVTVTPDMTFHPWTAKAPNPLVAVMPGDVIAVFTDTVELAAVNCTSATKELMLMGMQPAMEPIDNSYFFSYECWIPSVGYRVRATF